MFYVLLSLCILLVLWRWRLKKDPLEPPALPQNIPIVGHGLQLLIDSVGMFSILQRVSRQTTEMGGVIRSYMGPHLLYVVTDPDDCVTVTSACLHKHYIYNFMSPLIGNGLISADEATWKKHRKLLNPSFSQQVLDGFIGIFNDQAQRLVKLFASEVGKQFDHEAYLRSNTLETICATSFGVQLEQYGSLQKEYLPLLEELLHICNIRIKKFWLHSDFIFNLTFLKKRIDEVASHLHIFSDKIIRKKRSELASPVFLRNASGKLKPFINLILELAKDNPSLTDEQIRAETGTLIGAGHETVATTLTFALTLLGSNPEVQEKAYHEITDVLGESDRAIGKEDLSKLVYVEAIAKENLRLYPSAPVIARQLDEDIQLKNYTLRAGNGCVASIYGTHRHPIWGPDAEDFRSERWFEKDSLPNTKYYGTFGFGRRSCIGKTYALMSIKIVLTHVIRKYIITSEVSKMVVKMDTTIRPVEGFHITLKHRHSRLYKAKDEN